MKPKLTEIVLKRRKPPPRQICYNKQIRIPCYSAGLPFAGRTLLTGEFSSTDNFFVVSMYLIAEFSIVGFFQTQEESVLCAAGCCANPLEDKDGTEIKRGKKTTLQLNTVERGKKKPFLVLREIKAKACVMKLRMLKLPRLPH